jgi:hypothetical protein
MRSGSPEGRGQRKPPASVTTHEMRFCIVTNQVIFLAEHHSAAQIPGKTARANQDRKENEMILKYIAFWIPLVIIGIINGTAREAGYGRFVNELLAHQISTVTAIILFLWVRVVPRRQVANRVSRPGHSNRRDMAGAYGCF